MNSPLEIVIAIRRALRMDASVQAQRPIESAAERTGASVGPEGR